MARRFALGGWWLALVSLSMMLSSAALGQYLDSLEYQDRGDRWEAVAHNLPPIYSVRFGR